MESGWGYDDRAVVLYHDDASNGKVLAIGGRIHTGPDYFDYKAIAWADLYDPTTKKWNAHWHDVDQSRRSFRRSSE